jgi:hypothetical protein
MKKFLTRGPGLLLAATLTLAGCPYLVKPETPGKAKETAFGSMGPYKISSHRKLKEFNSAARAWFVERGFAPDASTTFSKIAVAASTVPDPNAGKEWEGHGALLCRHYGAVGWAYVFIPDYYLPKSQIQRIGYDISLSGNLDEVLKFRRDFDATKAEFVTRFPVDKVDPCKCDQPGDAKAGGEQHETR